MSKIPKLALQRLKLGAWGNSGFAKDGSGEAAGIPGGEGEYLHPDANLLSSFVEQTLTGPERSQLLEHLSRCSQCRELVMLAFPHEQAQAAMESGGSGFRVRPLFGWRVLRWGAFAAIGIAMIMLAVHGPWRVFEKAPENKQVAQLAPAPLPLPRTTALPESANTVEPRAMPSLPAARIVPKQLDSARGRKAAGSGSVTDTRGVLKESQNPQRTPTVPGNSALLSRAESQAQFASRAPRLQTVQSAPREERMAKTASQQPGAKSQDLSAAGVSLDSTQAEQARQAAPAAPPPQASAQTAPNTPSQTGEGNALISQAVQAPPVAPVQRFGQTPAGETSAAIAAQAKKPASRAALAAHLSPMMKSKAASTRLAGELNALWSITSANAGSAGAPAAQASASNRALVPSSGRLERSFDGGKSWEELHVDNSVSFRVVYASAQEVWAGGSSGALYHSADAGNHWTRVPLASASGASGGTITEINFTDSQRGSLKMESGEVWITSDGGQHWAEK